MVYVCFVGWLFLCLFFEFPFFTIIFATFLDTIDAEFASRGVLTKMQYQLVDKLFDTGGIFGFWGIHFFI
jgi:hypothetical protein